MTIFRYLLILSILALSAFTVQGLTVTGYDPNVNDRFESGFPNTPVENSHTSFIGEEYDWRGVGWSTNTADSAVFYKNHALLSPRHFLTAQHFENTNASGSDLTQGVRSLDQGGNVHTADTDSILNLGYGVVLTLRGVTDYDLALGRLQTAVASSTQLARYAVLDLHTTSTANSTTNYVGLDVLHYGRGGTTNSSPRIASAPIDGFNTFNSDPNQLVFRSARSTGLLLQGGDSASPALHGWTNPNGGKELTVLGVNSATSDDFNFMSFLASPGAMTAANSVMSPDGFALKIRGNPARTWEGGGGAPATQSNLGGNNQNWDGGNAPSDLYVLFDASSTTFLSPVVNQDVNLRGIYFNETVASGDGFSFGGSSTLTIGRGGITNYDNDRQVFTAPITLGDHQYWDIGSSGVTVANINTNGRLLEIGGSGSTIITGTVSGSGALALSGAHLVLEGNSTYTGSTWVHDGRLQVDGNITASAGVILAAPGELSGIGTVPLISGSGSVHPGLSPGILTAEAVDPTGGLDFFFEITQLASPDYGDASASGNDVLRLTSETPFLDTLDSNNDVNLFFNLPGGVNLNDVFRAGFFTDESAAFDDYIAGASMMFFVADASGAFIYDNNNYSVYSGPFSFVVSTVAETADFGSGNIDGRVMEITVVPEPAAVAILLGLVALAAAIRRKDKI